MARAANPSACRRTADSSASRSKSPRLWRPSSASRSHRISAASRPSSEVFFNAFGFWLRVPQLPIADLFGDGEELLKQLPEAVVFLQLLTRLLHGGSGREDPGHRLAGHRTWEGKGRTMALRTLVGAMARRLATLAEAGYQGTKAPLTDLRELRFQLVALSLQGLEVG